mmetsp:Transcript_47403/g.109713  ORF Transcript_47403/g.109713 Transcript_47403/m.109713 type:complete len:252 (-) Transcript_47403:132-887(-)
MFFALSSRKRPSVVRSSSLSSRAPLHWRSKRLWSWVSNFTSSLRSSKRSSNSCSSCRRSASVSMHTSSFPDMYRRSSCTSWRTFFSCSSMSARLLIQLLSSSFIRVRETSSSSLSATVFSPISRISCTLIALSFSWMERICLDSSILLRSQPSRAGNTSSSILRPTFAISALSLSTAMSSLLSPLFSVSFIASSSLVIRSSCTVNSASTLFNLVMWWCSRISMVHSPWPAFSRARKRSCWCLILPYRSYRS